jgi:hypothetical protein
MAANLEDVRKLLSETRKELLGKSNVVAVGVGYKTSAGKKTDELAMVCSVSTKRTKEALSTKELIPKSIQSIPTDVYPSGVIYAQQDPTGRFRPAPGGVSIGHVMITAGTLGCLVKKNNKNYILSNNHVLANSNDASPGDAILQPGPHDGGQLSNDKIAELSEFIPINFGGGSNGTPCPFANAAASVLNGLATIVGSKSRLQPIRPQAEDNLVDCAIAEPLNQNDVKNEILGYGPISGVAEGTLGMSIKKSGRTTGLTTGFIQQIDVTSQVSYGTNKTAVFVDQLMAGAMSAGGDSGSAVLSESNHIVGLLFAGSNTSTIINRIQNVFQLLNVDLV